MDKLSLSIEQRQAGLRAMREVALADGHQDTSEELLLESAASALALDVKPGELVPIDEAELATLFPDETSRERVIQAMVVMAVADGAVTTEESALIARYARALGISEPRVRNLEQIVEGHFVRLRFDILRQFPVVREIAANTLRHRGLFGFAKSFAILRGVARDDALAWRFKRLGLLPEGTLGRQFWVHMTANGMAFPGEPHGFNEFAVHNDFTHVIGGYDVSPAGKILASAFTAGFKQTDPFALVFATMLSFHLGLKIHPVAEPGQGNLNIVGAIHAFERGLTMNRDLSEGWDYWQDVEKPLDEFRAELGLVSPG